MVTIAELLASGAMCMECLARQTALRVEAIDRQIDALGARLREGHCSGCAESAPVFSLAR